MSIPEFIDWSYSWTFGLFPFLSIKKNIVCEYSSTCLLEHICIHSWSIGVGVELLSHSIFSTFNLFSLHFVSIYMHESSRWYSLQHYILSHFNFSHAGGCEIISHILYVVVPLFICLLMIRIFFFCGVPIQVSLSFFLWTVLVFILRVLFMIWITALC